MSGVWSIISKVMDKIFSKVTMYSLAGFGHLNGVIAHLDFSLRTDLLPPSHYQKMSHFLFSTLLYLGTLTMQNLLEFLHIKRSITFIIFEHKKYLFIHCWFWFPSNFYHLRMTWCYVQCVFVLCLHISKRTPKIKVQLNILNRLNSTSPGLHSVDWITLHC